MKWSKYSEAIFDAYVSEIPGLLVQAVPGAGKTTNIRHMWSMDARECAYLVFNKHTQVEAEEKLMVKPGSAICTLNSLGYRAVRNTFGRVMLDDRKVYNIIKEMYGNKLKKEQWSVLNKTVQLAKCISLTSDLTDTQYDGIVSIHDIDEYPGLQTQTRNVLQRSDEITDVIDFADQLRFPVIYQCNVPHYSVVLGDEVQDFNAVQAALLQHIKADSYVLVGDRNQSLYGFRGAMVGSMNYLAEWFNCQELPLSINYRCATSIVEEAAQIYPEIEPWEESSVGVVRNSTPQAEMLTLAPNDLVLCRLNRPLIEYAYELLRNNVACHVRGRDIGQGLVQLIERQKAIDVQHLIGKLCDARDVELLKAQMKDDIGKAQRVEDKYNSALLFCSKCSLDDAPDAVISEVQRLFEAGNGVCLTTVHKAKGLEADRALLLHTQLFSDFQRKASKAWQRVQERNILYVAVTRAKRELVYM
jgi:superfamily I DNA/RNA helicase